MFLEEERPLDWREELMQEIGRIKENDSRQRY